MAVSDLWGIGHRWAARLKILGIETALQLRASDPARLRARFGVVIPRLIYELRGVSCLDLEKLSPPKQQIIASRSFGRPVTDREELCQALASHVARAAVKLRRQGSVTQALMVFIHTNRFKEQEPESHRACTLTLPAPTTDTGKLVGYAVKGVNALYQTGFRYKKAGIMLLNLSSASQGQLDLLDPGDDERSRLRMQVMDRINGKWGKGTLRSAREGFRQPWQRCARPDACRPIRPVGGIYHGYSATRRGGMTPLSWQITFAFISRLAVSPVVSLARSSGETH